MLTKIDTARDELVQTITDAFGDRSDDISFTELKDTVLFGFQEGVNAAILDTAFQIGENVWYISNRKIRPGKIISYQVYGIESADHRETYQRIKYQVAPTIPRTTTQHLEIFTSALDGTNIYHTQEEAQEAAVTP